MGTATELGFRLDKLGLFRDLGYEPHAGQLAVHVSEASRRVLACGVRWARPTTNAMRMLDRVLDAAGIAKRGQDGTKLDIHALRHTFCSRLARTNVALIKAQRLMGHSDPKLTAQVYAHVDAEDLRDAVEGLPPTTAEARAKEAQ